MACITTLIGLQGSKKGLGLRLVWVKGRWSTGIKISGSSCCSCFLSHLLDVGQRNDFQHFLMLHIFYRTLLESLPHWPPGLEPGTRWTYVFSLNRIGNILLTGSNTDTTNRNSTRDSNLLVHTLVQRLQHFISNLDLQDCHFACFKVEIRRFP